MKTWQFLILVCLNIWVLFAVTKMEAWFTFAFFASAGTLGMLVVKAFLWLDSKERGK